MRHIHKHVIYSYVCVLSLCICTIRMYVCYFLCLCVNNSLNSTIFFDIFQKHAKERYVLKMLSVLETNVFAGEDTMELEIRKEILLNAEV